MDNSEPIKIRLNRIDLLYLKKAADDAFKGQKPVDFDHVGFAIDVLLWDIKRKKRAEERAAEYDEDDMEEW